MSTPRLPSTEATQAATYVMRPASLIQHPIRVLHAAGGSGFTLLELLLAVLLMGIISTMIYSVLHVGVGFTARGEERILQLDRQQGLFNLLHSQIRSTTYDKKLQVPDIVVDGDMLRLLTRQSLGHNVNGLVLVFYRYNNRDQTLYYLEKRDFYNIDYQEDYRPDFVDMLPLYRIPSGDMAFDYDEDTFTVTVEYQGQQYYFLPKSGEMHEIPQ